MSFKKRVFACVAVIFLVISFAYVATEPEAAQKSTFVVIEKDNDLDISIVYHRDTKVMYVMTRGTRRSSGCVELLVNPDGTPMIYTEE